MSIFQSFFTFAAFIIKAHVFNMPHIQILTGYDILDIHLCKNIIYIKTLPPQLLPRLDYKVMAH